MKLPEPLDELSSDEQKILQQYLEPVRFAAGTHLFEEGSPGDGCYIIDEGEVRLEVQRAEVDSDGVPRSARTPRRTTSAIATC